MVAIYLPFKWTHILSVTLFLLVAFTDWFDGWLARRLNQITPFGAFLDPVADKLMVALTLVALVGQQGSLWLTVPSLIIVGREIMISALREWMAEIGRRTSVAVSYIGKLKTTAQMTAIAILLYSGNTREGLLGYAGLFLLYVAAALTLWSMIVYLRVAWPLFFSSATHSSAVKSAENGAQS